MRIDWNSLKTFITNANLYNYINYVELPTSYYTWIAYQDESFAVMLDKGSADCQDFVNNFKSQAILKNDISSDGIQMTRTTFVGRSRMLHCLFVAFTTSTNIHNDDTGFIKMSLRDTKGDITTDGTRAFMTELDFCPGATVAYSLYVGGIQTLENLDMDVSVDAILAPDISVDQGGKVYFVKNKVIMKPEETFIRNAINAGDIAGVKGYNVLRMLIKHAEGVQKRLQIEIQYYI
jgi:hypothetical protein